MFSGHLNETPKKIVDPQVSDDLKVNSNESRNFNDPKEFDDPQLFDDLKGISIGSMNFDNPEVYSDTSIFDGLVFWDARGGCKKSWSWFSAFISNA